MAAENGEVVYKKYLFYACVARWYAFTAAEVTKAIPSPEQETFAEVVSEAAVDFEHV